MFIKLIIVLLLGWAGFSLIKRLKDSASSSPAKSGHGQKMVACETCDTHVPESDVIVKNGKNFCSKEHSE